MRIRTLLMTFAMLALAGCSGQWSTDFDQVIDPAISKNWNVVSVDVIVPETLSVSNSNSLAPDANIVWHGDPDGDRRTQVAAIIEEGVQRGVAPLRGSVPVHVLVVLEEFHAVTPRALRIAPTAVHNIRFTIKVFDKRTGANLTSSVVIDADLEALTGAASTQAVARGLTQKIRITKHIAAVTAGWLGIALDPRREFSGLGR